MHFDDAGLRRDVTFGSSRVRRATDGVERYLTMMHCRLERASLLLVGMVMLKDVEMMSACCLRTTGAQQ